MSRWLVNRKKENIFIPFYSLLRERTCFYIVFIRSKRSFFCSSGRELHFEKSSCCSLVSEFGSSPFEKNCAKVIPKLCKLLLRLVALAQKNHTICGRDVNKRIVAGLNDASLECQA